MKIKRSITLFCVTMAGIATCLPYDHIIFRDGQESDVILYQINNEKIIFGYTGDKTNARQEVPTQDAYMVYIEDQGNVYLTPEGKRVSGEPKRADPKKNIVIYLTDGAEIGAENVQITENEIKYTSRGNGSGTSHIFSKGKLYESSIDKAKVFMIRYKSGMVDVITPFQKVEETPDTTIVETKEPEPQFVVVFHEVKRGNTLATVAETYNVTVEQIREWNDISSKTKPNKPLPAGMQLMIYQPKQ